MDPTFQQFDLNCERSASRRWSSRSGGLWRSLIPNFHPFEARALVVKREMWVTIGAAIRHLKAADRFELFPGLPHSERYGCEGAIYWVGRRLEAPQV
jgi:hypothetical protein